MIISQEQPKFKPVTVTLETREEVSAFIKIIDRLNKTGSFADNVDVRRLINGVSDAFTSQIIKY